jgi:Spy/CpxP family protein refolding chaperone
MNEFEPTVGYPWRTSAMRRIRDILHTTRLIPILAVLILVSGVVLAQGWGRGPHGPGEPGERHMERVLERLDLTEEQRAELEQKLPQFRETIQPSMERLREARASMNDLIHAEQLDEGAIRQAAAEVAEIEADVAVARAQHFQEMRQILTPEQLEELQQMRKQRGERRGPRGRGPQGGGYGQGPRPQEQDSDGS